MSPRTAALLLVISALFLHACRDRAGGRSPDAPSTASTGQSGAAAARPTTFTGTLESGVAAIGGETTGWRLVGDAQSGGLDVDVSKAADHANRLAGKRVTVTGRMSEKNWAERGRTQVLVAERIEAADEAR